jgi:hypothetical protein
MLYLLSSEQLLLSQSAAHHGDSWAAVFYVILSCTVTAGQLFLYCTYLHLSSFSCPSLPRTTVTAGTLFSPSSCLLNSTLLILLDFKDVEQWVIPNGDPKENV